MERLAAENEAVRRDQMSTKLSGNSLLPSVRTDEPETEDEGDLNLSEEKEKAELMAALADLKARRGDLTDRRTGIREATSSTKCYNCRQYGHYKSNCPQRTKSMYTERQPKRPSASECREYDGNHYMRDCP